MECKGCGSVIPEGNSVCPNCGNLSANNIEPIKPKKKTSIVLIIIVVVVAFIALIAGILFAVFVNSDKMVCKSSRGDITISYNKDGITGYYAVNMEFDLEEQQEYAKQIGIDAYLKEFNQWFIENSNGSCTIDGKTVE